jgi:hypothetical protein
MALRLPSESSRLRAADVPPALRRTHLLHRHPPVRSLAPSASPRTKQRLFDWPGLPHRTACASRFSQPLDALIRPVPGGLVSCHIRSWGCALQSFAPSVQPYAVSGVSLALLSFERTRTPPHAHRKRSKPTTARSSARLQRPKPSNTNPARRPPTEAENQRPLPVTADRSHLQPNGIRNRPESALAFRALLHTKVRHPLPAV